MQSRPKSKLFLKVHPYLEAYIRRGLPSLQMRWLWRYHKWIRVRANANFPLNDYRFFDANDDEIRLN
jgi:ribonuclease G